MVLAIPKIGDVDAVDGVVLDAWSQIVVREISESRRRVSEVRAPVFRPDGNPYLRRYLIGQLVIGQHGGEKITPFGTSFAASARV